MPRKRKLPSGMQLRGKTYYANFRRSGLHVRQRLSTDLRVATEMLTELKSRADRGTLGLHDNQIRYEDLKKRYIRHIRQTLRDHSQYERDLQRFEQFQKVARIKQITEDYVVRYRNWRQAGNGGAKQASNRTINREVAALRSMLSWAADPSRRYININPLKSLKPLEHDPIKVRRSLDVEEVQSILAASPDYSRPIWLMYLTTGIRHEELVAMEFDWIDFESKTVTIPASKAKSKKPREIPLCDEVMADLTRLRDEAPLRREISRKTPEGGVSHSHVFVTGANTPWRNNLLRHFYSVCKRANIDGAKRGGTVDIHSLRGTFATLSIDNGGSPVAVQNILGHSTLAMTMSVYAKATERGKRAALAALPFAKVSEPQHVIKMPKRA